jgi:glutamine amidotransferase
MIHIVDYGMGNLRSVQKAFERLGVDALVCDRPDQLRDAAAMVLPGVGAFRDAIDALNHHDLAGPIRDHIAADQPFLGICLGLQLLFDVSYEDGEYEGLGIVPGEVVRFESQPGLRIPHMGWNEVQFAQRHAVFDGVAAGSHFYFVHSYHVVPQDDSVIAARTDHGGEFVSAIARGNMVATQFHPEKSQNNGRRLFENFGRLAEANPLAQ